MEQASNGEHDVSKVIRLSIESYRDPAVSPLQIFKNVCVGAPNVEELFLIVNRGNKWVKAVIGYKNLDPEIGTTTNAGCVPSECIMESNIGPSCPYWSGPQSRAITRLHMPSKIMQEVFVEKISILEEMWGWTAAGTDWKIKPRSMSFLEKQDADADVKQVEVITPDVSKVSWRGHFFVLKITSSDEEFNYLKRLVPHRNIVFGFGELCERVEKNDRPVQMAYLMEHMSGGDLYSLIVDKNRPGKNLPPFPSHDALDILWQFANAVKHMHQEGVVHCDLKSPNVLISDTGSTSKTTSRYLVKVVDFGSAKESEGPNFIAGMGTYCYAAPEFFEQRKNKSFVITHPKKIDAYSFGIVAFELLTGEIYAQNYSEYCMNYGLPKFKADVIGGTLRPLLREKCEAHIKHSQKWTFRNLRRRERQLFERYWHLQQEDLISLIEKCWHKDIAERPSFGDICESLDSILARFHRELKAFPK